MTELPEPLRLANWLEQSAGASSVYRDRAAAELRRMHRELQRLTQQQMQPCAGRNCGSTNPNLHSAECFEDYEKATGMSSVEHAVIVGALFDFMGWLTSRKERIVLSSADNASPAVEAITEFAKMRGLSLADAKVTDWQNMTRGNDAA